MKRNKLFYILSLTLLYYIVIGHGCNHEDEPILHISTGWCDLYFADHLNTVMPETGPKNMANALVQAINGAQNSIDFAIYGMRETTEILNALENAVNRGVTVRGVVDCDANGAFYYSDTQTLIDTLPSGAIVLDNMSYIMHNKFFVFDNSSVWSGSTNISQTGINAEYNANWSIHVRHNGLAQAYTTEFEEMYSGVFHRSKTDNTTHVFPALSDGSIIECYFAPSDDAENNAIIRAINDAQQTIHVQIFYLTDPNIADALVDAHNRGVETRVIIDAVGARNNYSEHEDLRNEGISVKVENWGGKMHMKGAAIDSNTIIIGSQNWTKAGNDKNDENTLYIHNNLLAEAFVDNFNVYWNRIPNRWLTANPRAESADSIGSCTDGIDNDHDGIVDENP